MVVNLSVFLGCTERVLSSKILLTISRRYFFTTVYLNLPTFRMLLKDKGPGLAQAYDLQIGFGSNEFPDNR